MRYAAPFRADEIRRPLLGGGQGAFGRPNLSETTRYPFLDSEGGALRDLRVRGWETGCQRTYPPACPGEREFGGSGLTCRSSEWRGTGEPDRTGQTVPVHGQPGEARHPSRRTVTETMR